MTTAAPETARGTLVFIGVDTRGSSIMRLFPRWAALLGLDARIEGWDLRLGADAATYRDTVGRLAADPGIAGALVTSHKLGVYRHAGELFDELDRYARLCREVSCISRRDGRLHGQAKDPITAGMAIGDLLGPGRRLEEVPAVLCLGAGGAGTALAVRLRSTEPAPARVIVADKDPGRLATLGDIGAELAGEVELAEVGGAADADALLAAQPEGSLVVNATGMGKDVPGSPLSDRARFPRGALVWDLNYRGDLGFLRQARGQAAARGLELHDGWRYFLHGWSQHIAQVYGLELAPGGFERLAEAAEPLRQPTPATSPA
ncbi:MAG TPA: shikimate dehydrogenase [Actinomycetes bacterium]|nr:shikimate dehydrogenase [Actinomycetes bacterium]